MHSRSHISDLSPCHLTPEPVALSAILYCHPIFLKMRLFWGHSAPLRTAASTTCIGSGPYAPRARHEFGQSAASPPSPSVRPARQLSFSSGDRATRIP